jgi:hypothetical protein
MCFSRLIVGIKINNNIFQKELKKAKNSSRLVSIENNETKRFLSTF